MSMAVIESRQMGRPKKANGTVSVRIDEDAQQLARTASGFTGETMGDYISRVVREQADRDIRSGAERFLRDSDRRSGKTGGKGGQG